MSEKYGFAAPDILSQYGHESQMKKISAFAKTLPQIPEFEYFDDRKWTKRYNDVVTEYLHEKIDIEALKATLDVILNFSTYSRPPMWTWGVRLIYSRNAIEIYLTLPEDCFEKKDVFFRGMNDSLKNWVRYYREQVPLRVFMQNYENRSDFEDTDDYERWSEVT